MIDRSLKAEHYDDIYKSLAAEGATGWNAKDVDEDVSGMLAELLTASGARAKERFLECGCGLGNLTSFLCAYDLDVCALEISPTAARLAEERLAAQDFKAAVIVADACAPDFRSTLAALGPFALALDSLLLHNLIGESRRIFLENVRSVLKPDGRFLIMTMCGSPRAPRLRSAFDEASRRVVRGGLAELTFQTPDALREELLQAGFRIFYERIRFGREGRNEEDVFLAVAHGR